MRFKSKPWFTLICYGKIKPNIIMICRLDEKIKEHDKEKVSFERRTRELANLLETLEHFDLDVKTLCRLTAEAVANLTKVEPHFEEAIKKLRQFTWKVNEREYDKETDKLRSQNLVLREIIKSLKRKTQNDLSKSTDESTQKNNDVQNLANDFKKEQTITNDLTKCTKCSLTKCNLENKDIVSKSVDKKVLCIESHKNGIFYDEYVIGFSNTRQMKIKHSPMTSTKMAHLKLEIFDCEEKYHESSPDKVVILLKNLSTSIKIERTGINCATQTVLTRKCDNYTQTSITQIRDFQRLNVGHTVCIRSFFFYKMNIMFLQKVSSIKQMLNSEKRAIERNLSNLERTVDLLKCNTLHHARSMIENKSKCLRKEEFVECIERLTGG
ncbi:PREDICTED: uncharacterized protein LOC107067601 [Polistes dominula]|uniref:Uncharacterized protein LOC107067601 n=1 Tax=Polistes dominula TaxID=743375 RepID=A0ABM1IEV3_POLDO|nr:PREDICTED: uncharacterized protein LOC107067601 [Polistes dominula]